MKTIIITGHDRAGKTSFSELFRDTGYAIFEAGAIVREEYIKDCSSMQISEFYSLNKERLENIIVAQAVGVHQMALEKEKNGCVFVGLRSSTLLKSIRRIFIDVIIIYMESSLSNRYKRYKIHTSLRIYEPNKTLQEFWENDRTQMKWGLGKYKDNADYIISNDGSLEELQHLFDRPSEELHCITVNHCEIKTPQHQ